MNSGPESYTHLPSPDGQAAFGAEIQTPATGKRMAEKPTAQGGTGSAIFFFAVIALIGFGLFKACTNWSVDDSVIRGLNREIHSMGSMNFASYNAFKNVEPDGPGSVAIHTSMYDKPENEKFAKLMCGSFANAVLNVEGAKDLKARVLSSDDTTLANCQ